MGLWATDPHGILKLIAREGDPLQVGPNDVRTISTLQFVTHSGNGDGRNSAFNDKGQIAFSAYFTDGSSGIFVSNLVAVPEPAAILSLTITVICNMTARRHSRPWMT